MRLLVFIFCLLTLPHFINGQTTSGSWTWVSGDSFRDRSNIYSIRGSKGIGSPTNKISGSKSFTSFCWKDAEDKVWLLGPSLNPSTGFFDSLEVWSYNSGSNQWTWEAGYDIKIPVDGSAPLSMKNQLYIVLNDDAFSNRYGSWEDNIGNLWFITKCYNASSLHNLIVKFDIKTLRLEIVSFNPVNSPSYGTLHQASSTNWPKVTEYPAGIWVHNSKVYIFGGSSLSQSLSSLNYPNELWDYNMSTNQWTWHGGDSLGSYYDFGIKSVSSASNRPLGRLNNPTRWTKGDHLYLFGGARQSPNGKFDTIYNDIWKYNVNTQLWTWVNGDSVPNSEGSYPTKTCNTTDGHSPPKSCFGGSLSNGICNNSFWYYSGIEGQVYEEKQSDQRHIRSDLWLYNPDLNQWKWIDGLRSDSSYNYGQKNVTTNSNRPPSRFYPLMWADNQDRLHILGGRATKIWDTDYQLLLYAGNDLWRYDPDYSCINSSLSEKFIDRNIQYRICSGDSTVVRVRLGFDSLRVSPMTGVRIVTTSTGAEVWLKPTASRNYKITAYGYRCESLLDSLTVPITISPPRTSTEVISICNGQTYKGKSTTGLHTIIYPIPGGCDSTLFLYLTILPPQTKIIDTTICEGSSVLGRTVTGVFIDTLVATNGCDSIRTLRLTVIPRQLRIDTPICRGSAFAGYSIAGTYLDTLTSPQGCITYRTIIIRMLEHSRSTHTESICSGDTYWGHSASGIYVDTIRASNGCDSIRILTLTVNPPSGSTLDTSICLGSNIRGHSTSGTHRDTLTDRNGCDSICILRLTVRPARPIKPLRNITICPGADTIIDAGLGHRSYLWSAGESTPQIRIATPQRYILQFVDSTGCPGRDSMMLSLFNPPQIKLPDTIQNYKGEYFFLEPIISPPATARSRFRWMPSGLFTCDTCSTVEFKPDTHLMASVHYTDERGCSATARSQILVFGKWAIGYPSAFSPNGDGQNDTYAPNTTNIKSYTLEIYNRWGEKVYQYTPERPTWDGTFKGEPAPVSTYYYYSEVILLNKAIYLYKGVFHLMR